MHKSYTAPRTGKHTQKHASYTQGLIRRCNATPQVHTFRNFCTETCTKVILQHPGRHVQRHSRAHRDTLKWTRQRTHPEKHMHIHRDTTKHAMLHTGTHTQKHVCTRKDTQVNTARHTGTHPQEHTHTQTQSNVPSTTQMHMLRNSHVYIETLTGAAPWQTVTHTYTERSVQCYAHICIQRHKGTLKST